MQTQKESTTAIVRNKDPGQPFKDQKLQLAEMARLKRENARIEEVAFLIKAGVGIRFKVMFQIFFYHFLCHLAYRRTEIPSRPKMLTPISLF